jgi:hypothetical protein
MLEIDQLINAVKASSQMRTYTTMKANGPRGEPCALVRQIGGKSVSPAVARRKRELELIKIKGSG